MTISRVLAAGVVGAGLGLGVFVPNAISQEAPPTSPPTTRPARGPVAPASLGAAMKEMEKLYKGLMADGPDTSKTDDNLRSVAMMERDAAISKLSLPPMVRRANGDDKARETEAYRVAMTGLMKALMNVEDAIAAKNPEDIKKALAGVDDVMKKGHEEFIPKREK
jgi:hypothetical protein